MQPNPKPDYIDMLIKHANRKPHYDASGYPADVQATILLVCEHWQIPPPRYAKDKGYWIEGARRVQDACGEFGNDLIPAYRAEYVKQTLERQARGLSPSVPFTVEGPNSLVKVLRAFAGTVREKAMQEAGELEKPNKYTSGNLAAFVEH